MNLCRMRGAFALKSRKKSDCGESTHRNVMRLTICRKVKFALQKATARVVFTLAVVMMLRIIRSVN